MIILGPLVGPRRLTSFVRSFVVYRLNDRLSFIVWHRLWVDMVVYTG